MWSFARRLWLLLLLASVAQAQPSATLEQLREDLRTGSLQPVLARQTLVSLPVGLRQRLFSDPAFQRFEITGFSDNGERFAARLRLHFVEAGVTFLRLEGESGADYRLTDWYDYSSGLRLSELVAEKDWLLGEQGRSFLQALQRDPSDASLAEQAAGRPAALALWLAQCSGQPCAALAASAQQPGKAPALWQLQTASSKTEFQQRHQALLEVLGDDPYLWWLEGLLAVHHQHCEWLGAALEQAWYRHPEERPLADVALQCFLAMGGEAAPFLDALSAQLGRQSVIQAIRLYYQQRGRAIPTELPATYR